MWDIHVSGCQFAACPVVSAQRTLAAVNPPVTCGVLNTYSLSEKLIKPARRTGQKAASETTARATDIQPMSCFRCCTPEALRRPCASVLLTPNPGATPPSYRFTLKCPASPFTFYV